MDGATVAHTAPPPVAIAVRHGPSQIGASTNRIDRISCFVSAFQRTTTPVGQLIIQKEPKPSASAPSRGAQQSRL